MKRVFSMIVFSFALFIGLILASNVSAVILNVPGNYPTIQSAIDNASVGDTINVSAGTYIEDLIINSSKINLELAGAGASSIIKGAANVPSASFPLAAPNIEILASGVEIHGFTIEQPDYSAGKYSSGMVIGAAGVRIYSNNFKTTGAANDGEISQAIQTYHKSAVPGVDISGLNIHDNTFTHLAGSASGFEAIWINLDEGIGIISINDNYFSGEVFRAVTSERNKTNIKNNVITTSLAPNFPGVGAWQGINIGGANDGAISGVYVLNNTIKGASSGKGFNYGIKLGYAAASGFDNIAVKNNTIQMTGAAGVYAKFSSNGIDVNWNDLSNNILGVRSDDALNTLDAENNWWGDCSGPSGVGTGTGSGVSSDVDFTPWLGACIKNKTKSQSCVISSDSVILYANVTSDVCIGDVIFSVNKNGTWGNFSGSVSGSGIGNYAYTVSGLTGGANVYWTVYADDCYGHVTKNGNENFYVNKKTNATISSVLGLNNWHVTMPWFSLTNNDATQKFYRWDGTGTHNYTVPFNLTDIPNPPPELAGILKLTWWSNLICNRTEPEQNRMFYIDLTKPVIESSSPADGANAACSLRPTISAVISDVYGSNSGVDDNSLVMKVDSIIRNITKQRLNDVKTRISYSPTSDLSAGIHLVQISGQDNAGNMFDESFSFTISPGAGFDLNVISPVNKTRENPYESKQVEFSISTTSAVAKIEYEDNAGWKTLCNKCDSVSKRLSLNDGGHDITIRASDACGNQKNETRSIFIDSKLPKIAKIEPVKNKIVNGSKFYVKYSEDNLKSITLYYGNQSKQLVNCSSGNNKECFIGADLSSYNGQYFDYWFVVSDYLRNVSSRVNRIKVDTGIPGLNAASPMNANYTRRVLFNITLSEKAKLEYYDNSVLRPRWTSLCSDCNKYQNIRTFSAGIHDIIIRATDKAGNSDEIARVFNVI